MRHSGCGVTGVQARHPQSRDDRLFDCLRVAHLDVLTELDQVRAQCLHDRLARS